MNEKNNFKRMCSFYVSNMHLITMLLPYLSEKVEKGEKIITFLEKDLQDDMELLLSKINIREEIKKKIKEISWIKSKEIKYTDLKDNLKSEKAPINILVVGNKEYIQSININLEKFSSEKENVYIKEIDAYELSEAKKETNEIMKRYDVLLNTSGENDISEILGRKIV